MMTDKMFDTLVANGPLVASLAGFYYWATPRLVKSVLRNGGGEIVKRIVREANQEQSRETAEAFSRVRERLVAVETRLKDHARARSPRKRSAS